MDELHAAVTDTRGDKRGLLVDLADVALTYSAAVHAAGHHGQARLTSLDGLGGRGAHMVRLL